MQAPVLVLGDHELGSELLDVTNTNFCACLLGTLAEHLCQRMNVPRGAVVDDRDARCHRDPTERLEQWAFGVELGTEPACATLSRWVNFIQDSAIEVSRGIKFPWAAGL